MLPMEIDVPSAGMLQTCSKTGEELLAKSITSQPTTLTAIASSIARPPGRPRRDTDKTVMLCWGTGGRRGMRTAVRQRFDEFEFAAPQRGPSVTEATARKTSISAYLRLYFGAYVASGNHHA